ncbi:hypothetical protein URH17368_0222 [Alicyclobacillus hesperidum URH17-3-68]|uniref:Uncharacterized protein n=1 Tax=Alicyclobacillus hesperidum TaxID=89784 RepID=A0A1H2UAS9_9BACL|nr:hypothetical protein [Alicyclobacillus hesperidum]EJY57037.1 hypothetical protein URH17368_0222 [Alicyclobacillus hesperidum URH17-3-68]GLV14146.1 hypothetical protein Heshes_18300 [Alicyclobacillus hesperidum]SDW53067.1 hypothetical protein SAMN04489725_107117 [Alicyclobacillus hesperidum]
MNFSWQHAQRKLKQIAAVVIFVSILLGASGTVFTIVSTVMSHLGTSTVSVAPITQVPATTSSAFAPEGVTTYQPPVLEYNNFPSDSNPVTTGSSTTSPDPQDASNSALAAAMDTGGVYVGERITHVFGSMLKGVLNTLFLNTN